ncbi:uncharacterized protein LW93_10026 [Fusarium fujikuroi]|nr:uncharacterized protein LW93_10026 [Fusarium fujikuroi]
MSSKSANKSSPEFTSYYLQRTTQELSEDLDKVRNAEDFKADSIPFLVHALQQGAGLFSPEDQKRVVAIISVHYSERTMAFHIRSFAISGLLRAILHHFLRDKDMSDHKDGVFLCR